MGNFFKLLTKILRCKLNIMMSNFSGSQKQQLPPLSCFLVAFNYYSVKDTKFVEKTVGYFAVKSI